MASRAPRDEGTSCRRRPLKFPAKGHQIEVKRSQGTSSTPSPSYCSNENQGALKGTNLRGQTEPKRSFSQIMSDFFSFRFSPFPGKKALGKRRSAQKTADLRRKPQIFAGNRRKPQEPAENRRLAFAPLGLSP